MSKYRNVELMMVVKLTKDDQKDKMFLGSGPACQLPLL
jgi:hypothetical protein